MDKRGEDCRFRPLLARDFISVSSVCQNSGEKVAKDKIKMKLYLFGYIWSSLSSGERVGGKVDEERRPRRSIHVRKDM
jgi:hypothetical protein